MKTKGIVLTALASLSGLLVGVLLFYIFQITQMPVGKGQTEIIYEVLPNKSLKTVAHELQERGLLPHPDIFVWYARLRGQAQKIKVGEYSLNSQMTMDQILQVVNSGVSIARPLTIPEGLNIFEIAEVIEKFGVSRQKEILDLCRNKEFATQLVGYSVSSLEGYLFPETYEFTKYTDLKTILKTMVQNFNKNFEEVSAQLASQSTAPVRLTRHQQITLASIVEKETGAGQERPLIASVFYNRLVKHMRLQTDPTIIYGLALKKGEVPKNISRADILHPTDYNTYVISGLPPGPIANPGLAALKAIFQPAKSEYFYFVSQNNGTHIFSKDYKDHAKAVDQFQKNAKAREGKSWRDLGKDKK